MFSDASAGAGQFFTYEFDQHAEDMRKYVHLYTGKAGDTEIAVLCPTTLYRLGGDLHPTISAAARLRDLCDFDVLDELLIGDGALATGKYKVLVLVQTQMIDQPILDKLAEFRGAGGKIVLVGNSAMANAEGKEWSFASRLARVPEMQSNKAWLTELGKMLEGCKGYDGKIDGLWSTRRGHELFILNTTDKPVRHPTAGLIQPHAIWTSDK